MKIDKSKKREIRYEDIRQGTVFVFKENAYIKTDSGAVNLLDGSTSMPSEWNECYIYPNASLRLGQ